MNSGKLVTVAILTVALAAATFAWMHNRQKGQRALSFWGGDHASRIRQSPQVRLLKLKPSNDPNDIDDSSAIFEAEDQAYAVVGQQDISQARGLVHARQALISDASFRWNDPEPAANSGGWQYAMVFSGLPSAAQDAAASGDSEANFSETMVLIDLDGRRLTRLGSAQMATITIADGMRTFIEEQPLGGEDSE